MTKMGHDPRGFLEVSYVHERVVEGREGRRVIRCFPPVLATDALGNVNSWRSKLLAIRPHAH